MCDCLDCCACPPPPPPPPHLPLTQSIFAGEAARGEAEDLDGEQADDIFDPARLIAAV